MVWETKSGCPFLGWCQREILLHRILTDISKPFLLVSVTTSSWAMLLNFVKYYLSFPTWILFWNCNVCENASWVTVMQTNRIIHFPKLIPTIWSFLRIVSWWILQKYQISGRLKTHQQNYSYSVVPHLVTKMGTISQCLLSSQCLRHLFNGH